MSEQIFAYMIILLWSEYFILHDKESTQQLVFLKIDDFTIDNTYISGYNVYISNTKQNTVCNTGGLFMDYDRIILEMLDRIKRLEEKMDALEQTPSNNGFAKPVMEGNGSRKYQALTDYLSNVEETALSLTFEKIEEILGFQLPKSAYNHRAFWSNTKTHSVSLSWLNAGFETTGVDLEQHIVTFQKGLPSWEGEHLGIEIVWDKIVEHEGEVFSTKTGVEFTYRMVGDQAIQTSQTDWLLNKANFLKAMRLMPVKGPGGYGQQVMGPSYVYALLTDPRIISEE